jgi:hypothetical protein
MAAGVVNVVIEVGMTGPAPLPSRMTIHRIHCQRCWMTVTRGILARGKGVIEGGGERKGAAASDMDAVLLLSSTMMIIAVPVVPIG